jgi:DNA-binding response OmpR family regulator
MEAVPTLVDTKHVLIVEDDPGTAAILEEILLGDGYTVSRANDGDQCLAEIAERMPDVVVLDLMLPKRSGWSVLEELRRNRQTKGIKVVVVSAFAHLMLKANPSRPDAIVEKPFNLEELLRQVRRVA